MDYVRPVRLPDRFYLPRRSYSGQEIFDVVPWEGATDYVTDGERYGILMEDRSVRWLENSRTEQFQEDFAGIDLSALVDGLQEYCRRYRVLQSVWKQDIDALDRIRSDQGEPGRTPDDTTRSNAQPQH